MVGAVLILHAAADEAFVRGYLAPALGLPGDSPRLRSAGQLARLPLPELERELEDAYPVIAVLTPAFLADPWLRQAEALAGTAAIAGRATLVALVLRECALPLHLAARVSLDFRDPGHWDEELRQLTAFLARPAQAPAPLPCPYPGARPFGAGDAAYFHGREDEIAEVLARLDGGERELGVSGPSGAGKTSLIAAGVLPALIRRAAAADPERQAKVMVRTVRFSDSAGSPARQLAAALTGVEGDEAAATPPAIEAAATALLDDGDRRLLLFLDQLEEVLRAAPRQQRRLAEALRQLRAIPRCVLLLCARRGACDALRARGLWTEGDCAPQLLAPLRHAALQATITRPAQALGVQLEPELLVRLLDEAGEEPGAMPFLQAALVELWARRRQRLLPLAAYEELRQGEHGGLAMALARRAAQCLGELAPPRARLARRALLRLVSFGEGCPDGRRRLPCAALHDEPASEVSDLRPAGDGGSDDGGAVPAPRAPGDELHAVVRALAAARLVVLDADAAPGAGGCAAPSSDAAAEPGATSVELGHRALITACPAFAGWAAAHRAEEQQRRRLQSCAEEWIAHGRPTGELLTRRELSAALAWRRAAGAELGESPEIAQLVAASRDERARVKRHRRVRRWRSLALFAIFALLATARYASEGSLGLDPRGSDRTAQLLADASPSAPVAPEPAPLGHLIAAAEIDRLIRSWDPRRDRDGALVSGGWCPPVDPSAAGGQQAPIACRVDANDRAPWDRLLDGVLIPRGQRLR